jgi:hypothetical protein
MFIEDYDELEGFAAFQEAVEFEIEAAPQAVA